MDIMAPGWAKSVKRPMPAGGSTRFSGLADAARCFGGNAK
jgi:hypothetical protein